MRTFTFWAGTVFPGIGVNEQHGAHHVMLGNRGEGSHFIKLSLDRRNPPPIVDGKVHSAIPLKVSGDDARYVLAATPESAEERSALVRVKTDSIAPDGRKGEGGWTVQVGTPQFIAVGQGAHVQDERVHTWDDGVVLMRVGDVINVSLEDGEKCFSLYLHPANGLQCSPITPRNDTVIVPPFATEHSPN